MEISGHRNMAAIQVVMGEVNAAVCPLIQRTMGGSFFLSVFVSVVLRGWQINHETT